MSRCLLESNLCFEIGPFKIENVKLLFIVSYNTILRFLICNFASLFIFACFSISINMSYHLSESEKILARISRYKKKLRILKGEPDPAKRDIMSKIYQLKIKREQIRLKIYRLKWNFRFCMFRPYRQPRFSQIPKFKSQSL